MARTIQSPGVQISEVDLSLRAAVSDATQVLIAGFAPVGPTLEPISISSLSEFEQVFGTPTNGAERYFYHTVKATFQSPASVTVARLPYGAGLGSGFGSKYTALVYPVRGKKESNNDIQTNLTSLSDNGDMVLLGRPSLIELSDTDYENIVNGSAFNWSSNANNSNGTFSSVADLAKAGIIVLNKSKLVTNPRFEGYYLGIIDNTTVNPEVDFRGINSCLTVASTGSKTGGVTSQYITLNTSRLNFTLSGTFDQGVSSDSISEIMETINTPSGSTWTIGTTGYRDTLNFGLFKLRQSVFSPDVLQLDAVLTDKFAGSIDFKREINPESGGPATSFFIENVDQSSQNVTVLVNPYISNKEGDALLDQNNIPKRAVRVLSQGLKYAASVNSGFTGIAANVVDTFIAEIGDAGSLFPIGTYVVENSGDRNVGNIPGKLEKVFTKMENYDIYPLTLTVEGGLGTVFASACATGGTFDDSKYITAVNGLSSSDYLVDQDTIDYRANWLAVFNTFRSFAQDRRKDHMFIADPALPIFVQGDTLKTVDKINSNFTSNIYWPLRNLTSSINTSYATMYATCVRVNDVASSKQTWVPFSGFAAGIMANTDTNFQPWFAPAGFTRGVIGGVNDVSIYPKQKQRDQLYKIGINPVAFFPAEGFVIYGQKTLQKAPSAFDRINVRRLFINLETLVRDTVKFFIFEPNTLFTRTQVINTLTPFFENAKNTQGLYDYLIICDEKNNTPAVIDDNTLVVDMYLKPTRSAEYILVNFYATRTGQDFNEIIS
jgi:hypothetical protein